MAMLYAMLIFTPAQIYMTLMTGSGVAAVAWFTLILWVELSRLSGGKISKQEAFFILSFSSVAGLSGLTLIYWAWFRQSEYATIFGVANLIPDWAAPPPSANVLTLRTFLNSAWILPIGVSLVSALVAFSLSLGLSLFSREVFIEVERLPFPMQQMSGQALEVLTEGGKGGLHIFSIGTVVGFCYSALMYTAPLILQAWTGTYVEFIPIPFIDLNKTIEKFMPGAILGIGTSLISLMSFWLVPFRVALATFLAAVGVGVFGNWLSVAYRLVPDTDPVMAGYQSWWYQGMDIGLATYRSTMFFWASILIGTGFAVGLAPIIGHPKRFLQTLKLAIRPPRMGSKAEDRILQPISFYKVILPLIAVGVVGGIALFWLLAPGFVSSFPWIIAFLIIFPFLGTLVVNRLVGTVGTSENPFSQATNIAYFSAQLKYPGLEQWFVSNPMGTTGDASNYKVCQFLETRDTDYIKMQVILWPISIAVGYLYIQLFWSIAPIPSARWPYISIYWPVQAAQFGVMIKGLQSGLLHVDWIIIVTVALLAFYIALDRLHSPLPYLAIAAGLFPQNVPFIIAGFIGAIIAHLIHRQMGDEWWYENRNILWAGAATGTALAVTMAVAISMIINSVWYLPI